MSWKTVKLSEVCELINGRAYSQSELLEVGKYPVLRVGNFFTNRNWYYSDLELEDKKYCDFGDLLYAWSASFGPRFWDGKKSIFHYHIWKVEVNSKLIDKRFLYHFFDWDVENIKKESGTGTTMMHVSKKSMDSRIINLPSLKIQQKIVAKLDTILAEIEIAKAAAEDNAKNTEALFQSYLSKIIKNESENSKTVKLGMICEIARGGSPRPIDKFITNDKDGINWIKIGDATRSKKYIYETREKIIKEGVSRSRLVKDGDFLLSNSMSYGRPYIMRTTGCIHDGWLVLSKYEEFLDIDFFYYLLSSAIVVRQFDSLAQGSTVSNLNKELVSRVEVKLPSLSKQKLIVYKLNELSNNVDIIKKSYANKATELLKLKNSILQRAFSGELVKD